MDVIAFSSEVAKQGLGYLLFIFTLCVLIWRERSNDVTIKTLQSQVIDMTERRIADLKQIQEAAYERSTEERSFFEAATEKTKSAIDNMSSMLQNIQTILNLKK